MKKYVYSVLLASALLSCDKDDFCPPPGHKPAGALDFDGINDEVVTGDWFRYQVFTIQLWVKPRSTQKAYANIIDNEHASFVSWVIQQDGGQTNKYYFGGGGLAYFTLEADIWQHVTVVKDVTSVSAYVNGVLIDASPLETKLITYLAGHQLRLGQWSGGGGRAWNGQMDEVRLWKRALSKAEIKANMDCPLSGFEAGLVAYYKFSHGKVDANNTVFKSLTDHSRNNRTGTLKNFALTGNKSNWVAGKALGSCN